jgi:hypothetical protein
MNTGISEKRHTGIIILITLSLLSMSFIIAAGTGSSASFDIGEEVKGFDDLDFNGLESLGYRSRYPYEGSYFIQTPEPIPEDAVYPPTSMTPSSRSSAPTRATWDEYYNDGTLTVYVDVSASGGGQLSSGEEQLLDRYISDFVNISFPRIKDWYDPLDKIDSAEFYVHQIDGASGVGGYYSPGTDEFHVDRADLSWAGVITAHEFEHYVHRQYDMYENLWVDEGSADYAAYLVYGISSATAGHVYAYLEYRPYYGLVVTDQTFYQDGTTAYYGVSFLYQIYMAHHYGGKNYTRALVRQTSRGTTGVTRALSSLGSQDDFHDSFRKWMVATRLNSDDVGDGEYVYPEQTYPYGQIRSKITKSHSGIPVADSRDIAGHSITTLRFSSSPSSSQNYRLKLTFSSGSPMVAFYPETSTNKNVSFMDFGGSRSVTYDFNGWGSKFSAFQVVLSSSSYSSVEYDLDILDITAPISTASVQPRLPDGIDDWYVSSPKVTIQSESGAFIKYQIDGGAVQDYSQSFYLEDGEHSVAYWASDRHGNIEEKKFLQFKVDTKGPTSTIDVEPSLPEGQWYTTPPYITLATNHPESIIEYKFGNDDFQTYTGEFQPPEGESALYWRAVDQAGNREDVKTMSFKVDTLPPHLDYTVYPLEPNGENGWYVSTPQVTLTSMDAAAIYYAFDNSQFLLYEAPIQIPDGEVTLRLTCVDGAGNDGDEYRLKFKVDTVEPELTGQFSGFEYTPENSSYWMNHPPILEVLASEPDMTINYTINEGEAKDYEMAFEIPEGENEIWVYGRDKAGNQAQPLYYLVKVDKRVPFIDHTFTEVLNNGWFHRSNAAIELSAAEEDERSSQVKIYYRWGTETPSLYKGRVDIPEGINSFTYWAEDLAGNQMEPRTLQVKKDSTEPLLFLDIDGLDEGRIDAGKNFTVDLTGSSDESGISGYSIDYYQAGTPSWSMEGVFENFFSEPGTYEVTVFVRDAAGNVVNQTFSVEVLEVKDENLPVDNGSSTDNTLLVILIAIGIVLILLMIALAVVVVIKRQREVHHVHLTPPAHPPMVIGGKMQGNTIHKPQSQVISKGQAMPQAPPKPPVSPLPPVS